MQGLFQKRAHFRAPLPINIHLFIEKKHQISVCPLFRCDSHSWLGVRQNTLKLGGRTRITERSVLLEYVLEKSVCCHIKSCQFLQH